VKVNLVGRVNNIKLNKTKVLRPVFEAVVNSFEAIEDCNAGSSGYINIKVERDTSQTQIADGEHSEFPIFGFIVEDNGIGFNDNNYDSFQTSDTLFKQSRGGKGVGRFLWLKAFDKVNISSVFEKNSSLFKREFVFFLTDDDIPAAQPEKIVNGIRSTIVHLFGLKSEYRDACPKKLNTIAIRMIEHCLSFFLRPDSCPRVLLTDSETSICLNEEFDQYVMDYTVYGQFEIKGRQFNILHLKLQSTEERVHGIHYCADNRDVMFEPLHSRIPNLSKKIIKEDDGKSYWYLGYVSGDYLDQCVNSERTDFDMPEENPLNFPDVIARNELSAAVTEQVKTHLAGYLKKINQEKVKKIKSYVQNKAIEYRPLLKHKPDVIEAISPDVTEEDKIELELHKLQSDFEIELKKQGQDILSDKPKSTKDLPIYKKKLTTYIEKVNDVGRSKLANYIIHRRVILEILGNNLKYDKESKYELEEAIHEIVFPLRATSDDVGADQQNLWLIDEKLAYHFFLASEKALKQVEPANSDETKKPDLIIFNRPFAFVDEDTPYGSIVVVEFKRPGRDDYSDHDLKRNPIAQVYNYIDLIRKGEAKDKDGQELAIQKNVPFYGYIIADMTKSLRRLAGNAMLTRTPDNMGYYGYNQNYDAYIEIISYQKLVADAQKRNQILFKKLNLPTA